MWSLVKQILRKCVRCKENERVTDAFDRQKTRIIKRICSNSNTIKEKDFFNKLSDMGISKGDTIMVHTSWRKFFRYEGTPESFISRLIELVGVEGTVLMPCYGNDKKYFDVNETPSYAGVLSEVFRTYPGVIRSECSHFSVCGYGKLAEVLLSSHKNSEFGFDYHSPYYLFAQIPDGKIVKLGMGKYPIKMTLIHCIEYVYKDIYPYFNDYLSERYEATIIDSNGNSHKQKMIAGVGGKLYKRNITKLYKKIPEEFNKYKKVKNIDIRIFNANIAYQELVKFINDGTSMLNPPITKKDSFVPINK